MRERGRIQTLSETGNEMAGEAESGTGSEPTKATPSGSVHGVFIDAHGDADSTAPPRITSDLASSIRDNISITSATVSDTTISNSASDTRFSDTNNTSSSSRTPTRTRAAMRSFGSAVRGLVSARYHRYCELSEATGGASRTAARSDVGPLERDKVEGEGENDGDDRADADSDARAGPVLAS